MVFLTSVGELGGHLERLPDGELGARSIWIAWQRDVFKKLDGFDEVPPAPGVLEGVWTTGIEKSSIPARIAALADLVPNTVPVGYHLCYGDSGHRHFKQPESTRIMVDVANGILESAGRSIAWFHMPVPKNRTDDAYFEPLSELRRPETTALYLGLVHATDGEVGSRARITTASRHTQRFGVATECGMGRRPPETIPELLRIHARVSAANPVVAR